MVSVEQGARRCRHAEPQVRHAGILTLVITVWPSWLATNSFTFEAGALSSLLPPMKWEAKLCFSA